MALDTDSVAILTISLPEAVAGAVTSSFIVFDIIRNIVRGEVMSTRDKILLPLSISNMVSPVILSSSIACDVFSIDLNVYIEVLKYMLILYCMSSSSWLAACLCFFYYIKVMHFSSRSLSVLKKNIDALIPWTILVVEVMSLCGSFVNATLEIPSEKWNRRTRPNMTDSPIVYFDVMYLGNFVSYPLMIVTTVWIMASLTMHIHRMRRNVSTTGTIDLEAHQRVVRTLQHLVTFYLLFFGLLLFEYFIFLPAVWKACTYQMILLTFSPVQSLILIHGNPKLKESWSRMWRCDGLKALL